MMICQLHHLWYLNILGKGVSLVSSRGDFLWILGKLRLFSNQYMNAGVNSDHSKFKENMNIKEEWNKL